ncbi:MAG: glycosyltransferase [Methylomarinum sp.]|nr:glycosyltransferase [Methylomarinum sp.]
MKILWLSHQSPVSFGTTQLRCYQPSEYLAHANHYTKVQWIYDSNIKLDVDLVILCRVILDKATARIIARAKAKGIIVVYESDDLLFELEVASYFKKIGRSQHVDFIQPRLDAMLASDCVIVSTDYIADKVKQLGKDVYILRNGLNNSFLESAKKLQRKNSRDDSKEIKLGYFSGSPSHDFDFAILAEPLAIILDKYPNVRLNIVGELQLQGKMLSFEDRITRKCFVPYNKFPEEITKVDINLIPLELSEMFCQAKSELKYIEAGACGIPSIASSTDSYRKAINNRSNGLLVESEEEWVSALSYLIENADARLRMGGKAKIDSFENYSPSVRTRQWNNVLEEIMEVYNDVSKQRKNFVISTIYEAIVHFKFIVKGIQSCLKNKK